MQSSPRNVVSAPGVPSFLEELYVGRFRWDLVHPFPEQAADDRERGDAAVAGIERLLAERLDPTAFDLSGELPDGFLDRLQGGGFLRLGADRGLGGLDLSSYNTFRTIEAAARCSTSVALVMAAQNAIGVGAFLGSLPAGPLSELVRDRIAAGIVSGSADTEPSGAANTSRTTRATPVEDGAAYLLNGEKIHVGNAPLADVLTVSATVTENGRDVIRWFVVDTKSPGFQIVSWHEFMGIKGFPSGAMRLEDVRVPRERMLVEPPVDGEVRITPEGIRIVLKGRMYLIAAPSLATARLCLGWMRDFANRRVVDGRPLGGYDEVQRLIACSAADVFALQALVDWCLLAGQPEGGGGPAVNAIFEQNAAKNLSSVACWRVLERTMSLLAGEGYETAQSKANRGAPPLPLERWYRDARGFRISGGVDFQLDYWTSRIAILSYYYPPPDNLAEIESDDLDVPRDHHLEGRNRAHLQFAIAEARRFARTCLHVSRRHERALLGEREHLLIQLSQVANELLAMSLTLARASHLASRGQVWAQDLADVYCTAARHRLAACWRAIEEGDEPDHARVSDGWLGGHELDALLLGRAAPALATRSGA